MKKLFYFVCFVAATTFFSSYNALKAQGNLTFPEASPQAKVVQRVGLTDITVDYHSPKVNKRKVWGDLVPYNEIWRAGANENTVITFSTDVNIEGKPLAAGTYGLHMLPTETEWTLIFSKNYTSWGSFFYNEKEDALRVKVKPAKTNFHEWLTYEFTERNNNGAKLELRWEELSVPINISVNTKNIVINNMRNELRNIQGFTWQGPYQAAMYCINNDTNLLEAEKWLEQSIATQSNFSNLQLKSRLLVKQGKQKEADEYMQKALAAADETQLNAYGYQLLQQNKTKEAIEIFAKNVKLYPNSWNVYDSYAEAFQTSGDNKNAIKNYKLALAKAPDAQKDRLTKTIAKLEGK